MVSVFKQLDVLEYREPKSVTNKKPKKKLKIPTYIFNSPKEVKLSFLAGLIDSDGWVSKKRGTIGFCSKSSKLASDFIHLVHSMGESATISLSYNKTYDRMYYKAYLNKRVSYLFKDYIKVSWKAKHLDKPSSTSRNISKNKILEIEEIDQGELMDITVNTKDHLYNSSGYITHNTCGLAILYGAGANRLHRTLYEAGFTDYDVNDCKRIVKDIRKLYAGVWDFKKYLDGRLEAGDIIYNLLGRPIYFDNVDDIYMKGLNRLIQGSASDIVQDAFMNVNKAVEPFGAQCLITVHDEILMQAPDKSLDKCIELMENVMKNNVILKLDSGETIDLLIEGEESKVWVK